MSRDPYPWQQCYPECTCHTYVKSPRARRWYNLDCDVERYFWFTNVHYYETLSAERRQDVAKLVVSDAHTCGNKPRLAGTRLWIELALIEMVHGDFIERAADYTTPYEDYMDAIVVWFFDEWMRAGAGDGVVDEVDDGGEQST